MASPASYPSPTHSPTPEVKATPTHAGRLETGGDSEQSHSLILLCWVPLEWRSFSLVAWPACASCSAWQWDPDLLLPAAPTSSNIQCLVRGLLGGYAFFVPLLLWDSLNHSPCQVTGDDLKMQDWSIESIQILPAGTDIRGAKMKVSRLLVFTWRYFHMVESEGPGLTPHLYLHTVHDFGNSYLPL